MQSIQFNDGYKTYAINGDESRIIRINASDLNLKKRIDDMQPELEHLVEEYGGNVSSEKLIEADTRVREILNHVFGSDVCTPAFGEANLFSPVGGGEFLFQSFLNALLPVIQADIQAILPKETPTIRPEVQNYLSDIPDIEAMTSEQKNALLKRLLS